MNPPEVFVMIRNDDLCALSDPAHERAVLDVFEKHRVPLAVAVIPELCDDPHRSRSGATFPLAENAGIVELLRRGQEQGSLEVALHGFTHRTNRLRPGRADLEQCEKDYPGIDRLWSPHAPLRRGGFSEFAGLDRAEQAAKVESGVACLEATLGFRPLSYIFPWNSYDAQALDVVRECGFRFVPAEDEEGTYDGLDVVGACVWDWELRQGNDWLDRIFHANAPVLAHVGIHSWVYRRDASMLAWLDELLAELTGLANVHFILPRELPRVPGYQEALRGRQRRRNLLGEIGKHLGRSLQDERYYVLRPSYYESRVRRLRAVSAALSLGGRSGRELGSSLLSRGFKDRLLTLH